MSTEQLCIKKMGLTAVNSFYDYKTTRPEITHARKELNKLPVTSKHLVGIHYGSSARWDSKMLPPETLLSILSGLIDNFPNYHFVVFVGPREEESLRCLSVEIRRMDRVYIVQNRSLSEIIAIVSQICLIISTDSFIMHAAIAVKTNVVALFGPTSITEIDFFGFGNAITMGLECSPCFAKQKNECKNAINMSCVNNFPVSLIIASVNTYIEKRC
jgi:heptosyltransferase-2